MVEALRLGDNVDEILLLVFGGERDDVDARRSGNPLK